MLCCMLCENLQPAMRKHIMQHISAESALGDFADEHEKGFLVAAYLTREVDMLLVLFK